MITTLVIYTHNSETKLKQTLFSYTQLFNDIIVVDDCSDDETVIYVQTHFKQCRVIQNPYFMGYAVSINTAVEATLSDWVTVVQADTQMKMIPIVDEGSSVAVIVPSHLDVSFSFRSARRSCEMASQLSHAICIHKGKFIHTGGLDRLYYPGGYDWADFIYHVQQRGWDVVVDSQWQVDGAADLIDYWTDYRDHRQLLLIKNELLLTWKSTDSFLYWMMHVGVMFMSLFLFRILLLRSFFYAFGQWGPLCESRRYRLPIVLS